MIRREPEGNPVWGFLGMPVVRGLALTGLLVIISLLAMGDQVPHRLVEEPEPAARQAPAATSQAGVSPFDLEALRQRLPPEAIDRVLRYIDHYRENRRRGFRDALARSTRYLEPFRDIFREAGLPQELAWLPLIESGFMENAVSPAQAVGVWQFIEETGRRYNLRSSRFFDQKRDPIQSAQAAAQYLGHLYEEFQDWELALAAYNSGSGTVRWAVRTNTKQDLPTHFWDLDLPDETRAYVPAFLAAMLIAKNPEAFGFEEIEFEPQVTYEQVKVNPGIHLADLAPHLGLDLKSLKALNPALVAGITPPGSKPYMLRVPYGMRERLPEKLVGQAVNHPDWVVHRVSTADTLQRLAAQFRTNAKLIKEFNRLSSNGDLRPGRFVIIPL